VREGRVLGIDYPAAREDMVARLRSLMAQNGHPYMRNNGLKFPSGFPCNPDKKDLTSGHRLG
jgi:hypothetical protein